MPYWVYMLLVGDKSRGMNRKIYTGYTNKLMMRIAQHSGLTPTKGARLTRRQQIELVFLELYSSRKSAMRRERQLKHESPFNQKKNKLLLIEKFYTEYSHILDELNMKLIEHFEFLESLTKTLKNTEKKLINEIKSS